MKKQVSDMLNVLPLEIEQIRQSEQVTLERESEIVKKAKKPMEIVDSAWGPYTIFR